VAAEIHRVALFVQHALTMLGFFSEASSWIVWQAVAIAHSGWSCRCRATARISAGGISGSSPCTLNKQSCHPASLVSPPPRNASVPLIWESRVRQALKPCHEPPLAIACGRGNPDVLRTAQRGLFGDTHHHWFARDVQKWLAGKRVEAWRAG